MTQPELITEFCKRHGKIIPAKLKDSERSLCGEWIGITAIRRCEEMALKGTMYRWPNEGKFAVYGLTPAQPFYEVQSEFTPIPKPLKASEAIYYKNVEAFLKKYPSKPTPPPEKIIPKLW